MQAVILKRISLSAMLLVFIASTADAQSRRRRGGNDTPPPQEQAPVTNPATGNPVNVPAAPAGDPPEQRPHRSGKTVWELR